MNKYSKLITKLIKHIERLHKNVINDKKFLAEKEAQIKLEKKELDEVQRFLEKFLK